jgi:predicted ATPase
MATKGFAASEVEQIYARARELCQQMGETPQLFPVLAGLFSFYLVQGRLQIAHEMEEQLLSLAHRQQDPDLLLEAHHACWSTAIAPGELAVGRIHAEQGLALYDSQHHRAHAFLYTGHDPGVCGWSELALGLWLQGYPAQALQSSHKALALAHELTHPFSLAFALYFAAVLHQLCQEGQAAQERAEAAITLSAEQGFSYWLALGTILRGWALAEWEQGEEGIAQMRQGLAASRATGAERHWPYHLALLAEAYGKVGQVEEGLSTLAEALSLVDKNGERFYEAELYRLKGELLLAQEG